MIYKRASHTTVRIYRVILRMVTTMRPAVNGSSGEKQKILSDHSLFSIQSYRMTHRALYFENQKNHLNQVKCSKRKRKNIGQMVSGIGCGKR
jgi:hypothetical protein